MNEIKHKFQIKTEPQNLFNALTTGSGISNWWTTSATFEPKVGSRGEFFWRKFNWKVVVTLEKIEKDKLVVWRCNESNMQDTDAWKDTTIEFKIIDNGDQTTSLSFLQSGYKESPCYDICTDGWKFVLGDSLKSYLETGEGKPYKS